MSALCSGLLAGTAFCRRLTEFRTRINAGLAGALSGVVGGAAALLQSAWAANANLNYVAASGANQEQILFRWQFEGRDDFVDRPDASNLPAVRAANLRIIQSWRQFIQTPRGMPLPTGRSIALRVEEAETVVGLLDRINTEMRDSLCNVPYETWQQMTVLGSEEWTAPTITQALKDSAEARFRALVQGCTALHQALLEEVGEERVLERWQQALLRLGADLGELPPPPRRAGDYLDFPGVVGRMLNPTECPTIATFLSSISPVPEGDDRDLVVFQHLRWLVDVMNTELPMAGSGRPAPAVPTTAVERFHARLTLRQYIDRCTGLPRVRDDIMRAWGFSRRRAEAMIIASLMNDLNAARCIETDAVRLARRGLSMGCVTSWTARRDLTRAYTIENGGALPPLRPASEVPVIYPRGVQMREVPTATPVAMPDGVGLQFVLRIRLVDLCPGLAGDVDVDADLTVNLSVRSQPQWPPVRPAGTMSDSTQGKALVVRVHTTTSVAFWDAVVCGFNSLVVGRLYELINSGRSGSWGYRIPLPPSLVPFIAAIIVAAFIDDSETARNLDRRTQNLLVGQIGEMLRCLDRLAQSSNFHDESALENGAPEVGIKNFGKWLLTAPLINARLDDARCRSLLGGLGASTSSSSPPQSLISLLAPVSSDQLRTAPASDYGVDLDVDSFVESSLVSPRRAIRAAIAIPLLAPAWRPPTPTLTASTNLDGGTCTLYAIYQQRIVSFLSRGLDPINDYPFQLVFKVSNLAPVDAVRPRTLPVMLLGVSSSTGAVVDDLSGLLAAQPTVFRSLAARGPYRSGPTRGSTVPTPNEIPANGWVEWSFTLTLADLQPGRPLAVLNGSTFDRIILQIETTLGVGIASVSVPLFSGRDMEWFLPALNSSSVRVPESDRAGIVESRRVRDEGALQLVLHTCARQSTEERDRSGVSPGVPIPGESIRETARMELIQPAINPHDQFGTGFPRPGDGTGFPRPGAEPVFPQPGDEFERLRPVGTTGFPMPRIVDIVLGNLQAQPGADVVTVVPNLRNNH